MILIETYCVVMVALVAVAGILEGEPHISRVTLARLAVRAGRSGKRHIVREAKALYALSVVSN